MAGQIIRIENDKSREKASYGDDREFFSGVMALSISAIVVKIIGLVYKIPMLRLLGSEGMGYFNSAYEIYALFCTIATAGLPVAMSVMISRGHKREGAEERIFRVAVRLFMSLGVLGALLMLALAYPLSIFLGGGRALLAILAISPTVFFICVTSAFRGYYQGLGRMAPTAISQIIEAAGKLLLGMLFASAALACGYSTEVVAAFAVLGLLLGSAISSLYLFLLKRRSGQFSTALSRGSSSMIVRSLLRTAIPVTISAAVVSMTRMVDMTMILRRLQALGESSEAAFSAYGCYTTLAVPLFGIAPALVSSVALPLIPRLSAAIADRDGSRQTETVNAGLRLACLISMPIGMGMSLFSREILELLFGGHSAEIALAAPLLSVLGISVTLSCLVTVTNAILQAYGASHIPTVSMTAGAIVKIVLAYFLIGDSRIGIMGAPISTLVCDLLISLINLYFVIRHLPEGLDVGRSFIGPFSASVLATVIVRIVYGSAEARFGRGVLITLAAISSCAVIYALLCLLFKVVRMGELMALGRRGADTVRN